jgi:hypothetical protein
MDGAGRCDQHAAHEKNPDPADREVGNQQPADRTKNAEERN